MSRPRSRPDLFKPSPFSLILIDEDNRIVGHSRENSYYNFFHTLMCTGKTFPAGKYTLVVDVDWHESSSYDPEFEQVQVSVYSGEKVTVEEEINGEELLQKGMKEFCQRACFLEHRKYYRDDFGQGLW